MNPEPDVAEQVKRSVLETLAPLTGEEKLIKIRGDEDTDAFYNRSLDDGSYRLRPGARLRCVYSVLVCRTSRF